MIPDEKAPPSKPPYVPRPSSNGEHVAVKKMREKLASIAEHTVGATEALNERIEQLSEKVSSHPPTPSEEDIDPESDIAPSAPSELHLAIPRPGKKSNKLP